MHANLSTMLNAWLGLAAPDLSLPFQSQQLCAQHCAGSGFEYMGLQYGQECWCGSSGDEEKHTQHGPATCDLECVGDPSEQCGTLFSSLWAHFTSY